MTIRLWLERIRYPFVIVFVYLVQRHIFAAKRMIFLTLVSHSNHIQPMTFGNHPISIARMKNSMHLPQTYPQQTVASSTTLSLPRFGPPPTPPTCIFTTSQSHRNFPINEPMMMEMMIYPLKYIASNIMMYATPKVAACIADLMSCCNGEARKVTRDGSISA